jgi:hypothetical protein
MSLGCAAAAARADSITDYVHAEMGAGVSWYGAAQDGRWFQKGMEHDLGLSAPVLLAGFTGPLYTRESWGIDWHIDYVSLGHVSSQCECTPIDANYSLQTHSLKTPLPVDVPNANFVGNGNAQGIAITIEPYVLYKGWRLGVEAGIFPYRPNWNETVTNWTVVPNTPTSTVYADTPHAWQVGGVVGASIGRGPLSVSYQHYILPTRSDGGRSPAIWSGANVILVRARF